MDTEKRKELHVGKKVWVAQEGYSYGAKLEEPFESTVVSLGKKYFNVEGVRTGRFSLDTFEQDTRYNTYYKVYLSKQEILDKKEIAKLSDSLRRFFTGYGTLPISLEQMREICKIINIEQPKTE